MNEPDESNTARDVGLFIIGVLVLAAVLSGLLHWGLSGLEPELSTLPPSFDQQREKIEQVRQAVKQQAVPQAPGELDRLPHQHARDIFAGRYAKARAHKAIAVGPQRHWGYATRRASPLMAARAAMWFCERFRLRDGVEGECRVVHINDNWLVDTASQSDYRVHPAMIQRGIMPSAEAVLEGAYAAAPENKAMATTVEGVFGYATGHDSPSAAARAAVQYCESYRDRNKPKTTACVVQIINETWQ